MVLELSWTPPALGSGARVEGEGLGRDRQRAVGRFDPDDCRDDSDFEPRIGSAQIVARRLCVEAAGDLFRRRHREGVAGGGRKPTDLEFVLERLQFGLVSRPISSASTASLRLWKRDVVCC